MLKVVLEAPRHPLQLQPADLDVEASTRLAERLRLPTVGLRSGELRDLSEGDEGEGEGEGKWLLSWLAARPRAQLWYEEQAPGEGECQGEGELRDLVLELWHDE